MGEVAKKSKPQKSKPQGSTMEKTIEKILHSDFDPKKLTFTTMRKRINQHQSYVSYNDKIFVLLTPEFELSTGGLLSITEKNPNGDLLLVPLDENKNFKKLLRGINNSVDENWETIFGKSIVKTEVKRLELVRKNDNGANTFSIKLRMNNKTKEVLTKIYVKGVPVDTYSVEDVGKHVTWGSTIQMVIAIDKVWADNSVFVKKEFSDTDDRRCGVKLKVIQINVVKEGNNTAIKEWDVLRNSNTFGF